MLNRIGGNDKLFIVKISGHSHTITPNLRTDKIYDIHILLNTYYIYSKLLTFTSNRNPWFEEFWEDSFACKLAHNFPIVFQPGENDKVCNESSRLSDKVGYEQESKIQFVVDAVYAFAHALHKLHTDVCLNKGHTKHGKGTAKKVSSALNNRRYRNGNINNNSSRILKQTKDGTLSAVAAGQDQSLFNFPSLLAENYAKNNGALGVNYDNEGELDEQQDEATEEEPIKYVCPEMANYDGKDFYNNYLLNVSFIGKFPYGFYSFLFYAFQY